VLVDGYDGTLEEMYFSGVTALRRGYAILLMGGPGQGGVLVEKELYFRHDGEAVVSAQIDWLEQRPEVDTDRIALLGRSWGGYLAPRVATAEHRIAALIADAPQYAPGPGAAKMMPPGFRAEMEFGDAKSLNATLEDLMSREPTLEFIVNRGMFTHGFATPLEYLRDTLPYTGFAAGYAVVYQHLSRGITTW
jgi:dienelactone hydrolase